MVCVSKYKIWFWSKVLQIYYSKSNYKLNTLHSISTNLYVVPAFFPKYLQPNKTYNSLKESVYENSFVL